jgi:hypothetical protein
VFRQARFVAVLALTVTFVVALLILRLLDRDELKTWSPLPLGQSPLDTATAAPLYSPLTAPPTSVPPISAATLQAVRAARPSATPPAAPREQWPYVSPATWRAWALRMLAAAGLLGYIGLRLRDNQKA